MCNRILMMLNNMVDDCLIDGFMVKNHKSAISILDDVKTMLEGARMEVPGAIVDMIHRIGLY